MTPKRRELILKIADGNPECFPILYHFDRFKHADAILSYFIKENFIGQRFVELYKNEFQFSWLTMGKWAVMKITKDNKFRPIIGGKDYRV